MAVGLHLHSVYPLKQPYVSYHPAGLPHANLHSPTLHCLSPTAQLLLGAAS